MSQPLVTVVISPREGHFMAEQSLLSVLADDGLPFDLIYVDFAAPPAVSAALRSRAAAHKFKLVQRDEWMAPSAARKALLPDIKTKYVVFADNDILVEPGCLGKLVACAEETGAGLVCPLYLQAGAGRKPTIHMAGGVFTDGPDGRIAAEGHRLADEPIARAAGLIREKVGYTEYHYVLARMDLVGRPDAISDGVLLVHEHLDLALYAREQGLDVVFEPTARITYAAFEPRPLSDVDFFRRRWDIDACARSLDAFAHRWPRCEAAGFITPMIPYASGRLQEVDVRRYGSSGADLDQPMRPEELAQSRFALREQAAGRGYSREDQQEIEAACDLATLLFDSVYRPDGRPFLSHALGSASVLVRYEMQTVVVRAGLLHAAFSHRPEWMPEDELANVLRANHTDTLIRGQPFAREFFTSDDVDHDSLHMIGARVAAILAANEVDMRLSGEYRATGRPADLPPGILERITSALSPFGVDGLTASASAPLDEADAWPLLGGPVRHGSFRLDAKNRRTLAI